jgi:HEAT repeat protein
MSLLIPPARPNFEAALRDVRARTEQSRLAAAERLAEPDGGRREEAVKALLVLIDDARPRVRCTAVRSLGELAAGQALASLVARLDDADATVRENAAIAVYRIGGAEAARALRRALLSPHPEVRFQAVECCAELCPEQAGDDIARLVSDDDPKVRANAAHALGSIGGNRARKKLRAALSDTDPEVRREAALALARMKDATGLPVLRQALSEPAALFDALEALGELRDRESADLVAALARGFFLPLAAKAAAARTLVMLDDPRGVAILSKLLRGWRGDARGYAVQIAGELAITELGPELERLARRPRGVDAELLVASLARLAPASDAAVAGLRALSRSRGEAGRRALEELGKLGVAP